MSGGEYGGAAGPLIEGEVCGIGGIAAAALHNPGHAAAAAEIAGAADLEGKGGGADGPFALGWREGGDRQIGHQRHRACTHGDGFGKAPCIGVGDHQLQLFAFIGGRDAVATAVRANHGPVAAVGRGLPAVGKCTIPIGIGSGQSGDEGLAHHRRAADREAGRTAIGGIEQKASQERIVVGAAEGIGVVEAVDL